MMTTRSITMALVLLAAALGLTGCTDELSSLDAAKITKVVLTYPKGGVVVTNTQMIADLIQAMRSARMDNTLYDTAMTLHIEFYSNDTMVATVSAGGSFYRLGENQFFDRSGKFREIMRELTERGKTPNQASQVDGTNVGRRMSEAESLVAAHQYRLAADAFTTLLSEVTNGTHECNVKARLAACLLEMREYDKAIALCDEVTANWPRGSARFAPFLTKADCLAALGKTNEAMRAYQDHYANNSPGVHMKDEDIRKRMEAVRAKAVSSTPPPLP